MTITEIAAPIYEATVGHLYRGVAPNLEILLAERNSLFCNGIWNGPGGKCKELEPLLTCLKRELKEEIGVKIDTSTAILFASVDFWHKHERDSRLEWRVHFFKITKWSGDPEPKKKSGLSQLNWFPANNLPFHLMVPDQAIWMPKAHALPPGKIARITVRYAQKVVGPVEDCEIEIVDKTIRH